MQHWMISVTPDGDESGLYGTASFDGDIIPVPTEQDPDPYPICSMYYTSDETNAKLIASAPEMHDTLTAIAAALNCAPDDVVERVESLLPMIQRVGKCHAAWMDRYADDDELGGSCIVFKAGHYRAARNVVAPATPHEGVSDE